jgi:hypothetical protein
VLRGLSGLGYEILKDRRRQRDDGKCDGNIGAEVEVRLGGIVEEVEDTMNVFWGTCLVVATGNLGLDLDEFEEDGRIGGRAV